MRAIIINQPGDADVLQIRNVPEPVCRENEILIRVHAAGVNRPDIFQRKGNYPPPPDAPQDIPGLEVAGVIESVGKAISGWHAGDRVCALVAGGGYAEYVTADAGSCLPLPVGCSFAEAAALPETVCTVWSNVFDRGRLCAGETLLVHGGASGIGTVAIQLAVALGARVFATAGSDEKCRFCEEKGSEKGINYREQDFAEVLGRDKVDVILDMIGKDYFDRNLRVLKPEGRLVFINAVTGSDVQLNISRLMQKRITLTGSTLRSRDAAFKAKLMHTIRQRVWPLIEAGRFRPVIHRVFPLEKAADAHRCLEHGDHIGKVVLHVSGSPKKIQGEKGLVF
ncbi:MAG: NAD(P)H-quinone oxidoreductase [Mucilaginibacter polytrichastri]|nr:NAD(P)H-quinone oxidoreductase [Mucilaginibacter polytrichastri]